MPSPRISLLPIDSETASLLEDDAQAFETRYGLSVGGAAEFLLEVARQTIEFERRVPRIPAWGGYFVVDGDQRCVAGMAAYKNAPDETGDVEIAYGTVPLLEGRGYATATAAELTRRALAHDSVRRVLAHTLPERNASARILEKNGFQLLGEVVDPEDGLVWLWSRERTA